MTSFSDTFRKQTDVIGHGDDFDSTEEEHKLVGLVIVVKDSTDRDQVCLDTVTTSSNTSVENRQVGLVTTVRLWDLQFDQRQRKVLLKLTKKTHGCTFLLTYYELLQ
jgi:hypothetical protein